MIRLIKYSVVEIYQNKFYMFILFIISLITISTFYVMMSILALNLQNAIIPEEFKDNAIVSMVNLRPEVYEETPVDVYANYLSALSSSKYQSQMFQFSLTEFVSTTDEHISTGSVSGFNMDDNLELWNVNGIITSSNYLEKQEVTVEFKEGESFESFNSNKVLIPREYQELYRLGSTIEFYTPYYNKDSANLVELQNYEVVGYIEPKSSMFNPRDLQSLDVSTKIIFPDVNFTEFSSKNIEYDALYQSLIMSTFYYIDDQNIGDLTQEINEIANSNNIVIHLNNNTSALKLRSNSNKETLKNNLKSSVPTVILFTLGISYLISNILEKRMKYLSILALLGAKRKFIHSMYISSCSFVIVLANLVFVYIYHQYSGKELNELIIIINLIVILAIATLVIRRKLSIVNTNNIKTILKEKND